MPPSPQGEGTPRTPQSTSPTPAGRSGTSAAGVSLSNPAALRENGGNLYEMEKTRMKNVLKLGAVVLAIVMVLSMSVTAFATENTPVSIGSGVVGAFTTYESSADPQNTGDASKTTQSRVVKIQKQLIANNANSTSVYAPVFSYVYTVTPAAVENLTITDNNAVHSTNASVTVPVKPGVTTGLKVNNGTTGSDTSASGTLAFTNATLLSTTADTATSGVNTYDISLDFTGVTFSEAGVYRYQIVETLDGQDAAQNPTTYAGLAMTDAASGGNTRYLDVYVDGSGAIYGYVCLAANASVNGDTVKTNGFVSSSNGADTYYTYDLTVSKTVENDAYAKANHQFPFTIIFTTSTSGTFLITETPTTGSTGISPTAGTATWSGVAKIKDSCPITYTGIPVGTDVQIYETNDYAGTTYTAVTTVNSSSTPQSTNNAVTSTTTPTSAVAPTSNSAYQSTAYTFDTTAGTAVTALQTFNITNTLLNISPTGVALRVAPYALMLGVGLFLVLFSRRRKSQAEA